ncbi:MAG TPA: S24/S26 family peptidase [Thermoanaerobaculia bacterium]|nr:S24/S26 family peptidase [Thermoanaerobaculia bacterium]
MAPRIADGERVRIAAARVYWPGDVVAFRAGDGRLRLHRLLGYRPWGRGIALVTQGDHCPCHDGAVPLDHLLGRIEEPVRLADRLRAVLAAVRLVLR